MKDIRKAEIRVGITVLVALFVFIWLLGWAKNFSFGSDDTILSVRFNNIAGLTIGDVVMINGVKSGYVDDVKAVENSVIAKLNMEPNVDIRSDAKFSIMMLDLMGGKKVEISPGISSSKIDYSLIHSGLFAGDISSSMAMLATVQSDLIVVIREAKTAISSINKLISDDKFYDNLNKSVDNLSALAEKLSEIFSQNDENLSKILESSSELIDNTNTFLMDNKTNLDTAISRVNYLIENTNHLVTKMNKVFTEIETKENNLGELLYDKSFMDDMKSSLNQVKELSRILIEQLKGEGIKIDADIF
ncbi:MlaD family protein [Bacteroidota bacterium]